MRKAISIESRVAMSFESLGTRNMLCNVGVLYGVAKSTSSKIMRFFCRLVRVHLQCTLVQFPSPIWFRVLAQEFVAFHGISHIIRAIDGSHIQILIRVIAREDYYC